MVLTMLAEAFTTDIAKVEQPQGFDENQQVARRGGNVAGVARKALEAETGKPVVTAQSAESFRQLVTDIVTDAAQHRPLQPRCYHRRRLPRELQKSNPLPPVGDADTERVHPEGLCAE